MARRSAKPRRRTSSPRKALAHLRAADPVLARADRRRRPAAGTRATGRPDRDDHYGALVRAIVGQQLSVHAARAIYGRLTARFGGRPPTPAEILAEDPEELRAAAGLSRAKVSFLRSLAEHVISGELELERLDELADEEVIAELVAVKGLGMWTRADVPDVPPASAPTCCPSATSASAARSSAPTPCGSSPTRPRSRAIAEPWRPYRTLACRYLWRSLQNEPA